MVFLYSNNKKNMAPEHINLIAAELNIKSSQVQAAADLFMDGATIPFIARYRKEATGTLDEVAITTIRDRLDQLEELEIRRAAILKSLLEHGHLTEKLKEKVLAAPTLAVLEDIYLPYRPKRRTKATIAREKGLEPLAQQIFQQTGLDPARLATSFVDHEKNVSTVDDALEGARHIIAEMINEDPRARDQLRNLYLCKGLITSKVAAGKEIEGGKYKDYFEWDEPVAKAPSHRILAMRRGEKEEILNLTIAPPEDKAVQLLENLFVRGNSLDSIQVQLSVHDCYKRLLSRSMETEIRLDTKRQADIHAIKVFADNLRQLLLAPPLGRKRVLGIDPGFRTGCKVVCLDRQGKLLDHTTIFPHMNQKRDQEAAAQLSRFCTSYGIEAIAVGNGTAGRETESFVKGIADLHHIPVMLVNESGASVYSASETARREFPDLDLTVRGAVSIGRRLMDPLAELVKIDPKSIGVGQYQHDVDQASLKQALDNVVVSCVNAVGVDVNRASAELLTYVSGLGSRLARNIVAYRDDNGPFQSREELKNVPRLGPKAFEQSTGFLRIHGGSHPLDASAVHPESYPIVDAMAKDLACSVADLMENAAIRKQIKISNYVTEQSGLPTLVDIVSELEKPGRDPREDFESIEFAHGIETISDLTAGMILPGIVTNVTSFGAFVDIGVHQDGLVHISELADRFVKNPLEIVKVQQKVSVAVLAIDLNRNRVSLSMKSRPGERSNKRAVKQKKRSGPEGVNRRKSSFHSPSEAVLKKECS